MLKLIKFWGNAEKCVRLAGKMVWQSQIFVLHLHGKFIKPFKVI